MRFVRSFVRSFSFEVRRNIVFIVYNQSIFHLRLHVSTSLYFLSQTFLVSSTHGFYAVLAFLERMNMYVLIGVRLVCAVRETERALACDMLT